MTLVRQALGRLRSYSPSALTARWETNSDASREMSPLVLHPGDKAYNYSITRATRQTSLVPQGRRPHAPHRTPGQIINPYNIENK